MTTAKVEQVSSTASRGNARADIDADMADVPSRFTAIRMLVSAQCNPAEKLNKLVIIAERGCIAANTLRAAVELSA